MMRILLSGANGQVGFELRSALSEIGEVHAFDRMTLDLEKPEALQRACRSIKPALIVNAAAYTAVDRAESEPKRAAAVNADAPGLLAREARRLGATLIHYSTDYVFDGSKRTPYVEEDPTAPLNTYGRTKVEGEGRIAASGCKHLIFRTSWVYGPRGRNFLFTMLALSQTREELRIVDDQQGAPTSSLFLARATVRAIRAISDAGIPSGIYNLTAAGQTTWAGFARAIFAHAVALPGFRAPRVVPIPTSAYPTPAARPAYSVLSHRKFRGAFGFSPSSWEDQLADCFERLTPAA